jgi:RNA polymerase sigma factor (TIGR02999 family)
MDAAAAGKLALPLVEGVGAWRREHAAADTVPITAKTLTSAAHAVRLFIISRCYRRKPAPEQLTPVWVIYTGASVPDSQVTVLLSELRNGNDSAKSELVTLVYPELRRIAGHYMRQERPGHTLRTTGLVHEVYVRLFGTERVTWQNRAHFFAAVAREMRHILVDYARARNAKKRPDGNVLVSLSDVDAAASEREEDLVALDEALSRLERVDSRASRVVELRFFTGLSEKETAEAMGISISTLKRDWNFAKAWLFDQLTPG